MKSSNSEEIPWLVTFSITNIERTRIQEPPWKTASPRLFNDPIHAHQEKQVFREEEARALRERSQSAPRLQLSEGDSQEERENQSSAIIQLWRQVHQQMCVHWMLQWYMPKWCILQESTFPVTLKCLGIPGENWEERVGIIRRRKYT